MGIKPSNTNQSKGAIKASKADEKPLVFSFKYFDESNDKFHIEHKTVPYVVDMVKQLQTISRMTLSEIRKAGDALRFHSIDFKSPKVSEDTLDIKDPSIMADSCSYQFQISKRRGRIIGFILNNTFYIKWFDPEHNLYPMSFGITPCLRGMSDCDEKIEHRDNIIKEYTDILEELTTP
ncbi:MAG: hypothetical protein PHU40_09745 [Sulfurimonas sp.]|nr:hypothetical protein [Sulfurimonas sp.]